MSDLDALLDAAIERRTTDPETETVEVMVGDSTLVLKFTEMDSTEWANVIAVNPLRPSSAIDRRYGHNYHASARMAAPECGVRVDGDAETKLTLEQWEKLFKAIAPRDFNNIASAILSLNDFGPEQRLATAKKASAVVSAKKRRSPAK